MTWVKIDDGWPNNPKVEPLSKDAKLLYVCGLCYCGRNLTDGVLNTKAVKVVLLEAAAKPRHVAELHDAGLWDRLADGYLVHDYLIYNPSREKVLEERKKAKERMGKNRARKMGADVEDVDYDAIFRRDRGICRLCGRAVRLEDAEFDHIVPISQGGAHEADNIATTHRRCNRAKRANGPDHRFLSSAEHSGEHRPEQSPLRSPSPSRPVKIKGSSSEDEQPFQIPALRSIP